MTRKATCDRVRNRTAKEKPRWPPPMSEPAIGEIGKDSSLSELEKGLLGEALRLLAETRARWNSVSR